MHVARPDCRVGRGRAEAPDRTGAGFSSLGERVCGWASRKTAEPAEFDAAERTRRPFWALLRAIDSDADVLVAAFVMTAPLPAAGATLSELLAVIRVLRDWPRHHSCPLFFDLARGLCQSLEALLHLAPRSAHLRCFLPQPRSVRGGRPDEEEQR